MKIVVTLAILVVFNCESNWNSLTSCDSDLSCLNSNFAKSLNSFDLCKTQVTNCDLVCQANYTTFKACANYCKCDSTNKSDVLWNCVDKCQAISFSATYNDMVNCILIYCKVAPFFMAFWLLIVLCIGGCLACSGCIIFCICCICCKKPQTKNVYLIDPNNSQQLNTINRI